MALSIASNPNSLRVQTNLSKSDRQLGKVYEQLSSGLRINSASDDPAGLAIADSLKANSRNAAVAIRNANDGVSITSVADEALSQINDLLVRMSELATQGANGTYSISQRSTISSEYVSLGSEIERIAATTTFNGISLLSNSQAINLQVGLDGTSNSTIAITSVLGTLSSLGIGNSGGVLTYSILSTSTAASQSASQNALNAVTSAISTLTVARGSIGAVQSRLSFAINNLTSLRENFLSAESRIRDVDVAEASANLARLQVIREAATSILAQANQDPNKALALLK